MNKTLHTTCVLNYIMAWFNDMVKKEAYPRLIPRREEEAIIISFKTIDGSQILRTVTKKYVIF